MGFLARHRGVRPPSPSHDDIEAALFAHSSMLGGVAYIPGEAIVRIQERTTADTPHIQRVQQLLSSVLCRAWHTPDGYQALLECDIEDFCCLLNQARSDALAQGWVPRIFMFQHEWPELDAKHGRDLLALLPLPTEPVPRQEEKRQQLRRSVQASSRQELLMALGVLWATRDANESHFLSRANHAVSLRAILEHTERSQIEADVVFVLDRMKRIADGEEVSAALVDLHEWVSAFVGGTAENR